MKKVLNKKVISSVIFLVILLFFAIYIKDNGQTYLEQLSKITFSDFVVISLFSILFFVLNGFRAKMITEVFLDRKLKFWEWFGLAMTNTLGNYSPFQGGIVARGYYLKNYYKIAYSHFLSSMFATYFITFTVFSIVGVLLLVPLYLTTGIFTPIILIFFLGVAIFGLIWLFFGSKIRLKNVNNKRILKLINTFLEGWGIIKDDKKTILRLVLIDIASIIVISFRFFSAGQSIESGISLLESALISILATLSMIVNITPGGLGVMEAVAAFTAGVLGFEPSTGLLIATIERAVIVIWVFIIGIPFSALLAKRLTTKE